MTTINDELVPVVVEQTSGERALDADLVAFPGDHGGFESHPDAFADLLADVFPSPPSRDGAFL